MGSNPPELSLDFRPSFVPATIGDLLREVSAIGDARARSTKLDGYVARLQGEMSKIDAFKRELPLCMLLLKDGSFVCPPPFFLFWVLEILLVGGSKTVDLILQWGCLMRVSSPFADGFDSWVLVGFVFVLWFLIRSFHRLFVFFLFPFLGSPSLSSG